MTHTEMVRKWMADNGDKTLRLDYDLNEESVVIDGGGYVGGWSTDIYNKYKCNIYIFEPVKYYFDLLTKKFIENDKVHVYHVGLSNSNKDIDISISSDSSSVYNKNGKMENIKLVDIKSFLGDLDIDKVDLMKLNVEGEEYNILDRMIETDMVKDFDNLQIQFHRFVDKYDDRKKFIDSKILTSHTTTYEYNYVWVNYKRD